MLHVHSLSFSVGENEILSDISFKFDKGGILLVIGPNGAGKTTLLKILAGIYRNYRGSVLLDGAELKGMSLVKLSQKISYIPQIFKIPIPMTVLEFLLTSRFPYKNFFKDFTKSDMEKIHTVSEMMKLNKFLNRKMDTLSGGELQRVMIASSIVQESEYILLDEPATFLDPHHQLEVYEILNSLKDSGKGLVVVSHDLNSISLLDGKILGIKNGKVNFLESLNGKSLKEKLERLFEVKFLSFEIKNKKFYLFSFKN